MKSKLSNVLETLKQRAVGLGASDAKIIPTAMISIEDEVLEMCKKPLCDGFGKSINCPPHTMKPWEFREVIKHYEYALIFKLDIPQEVMLSEKQPEVFRKVYEIASKLEIQAFRVGLKQSLGFAAGSCRPVFCREHKMCQALKEKDGCRYPETARPSMEAVGMNVMKLVKNAGWEIQMINEQTEPDSVPNVVLSGLVILG
jgi:predicted metal-binding protein